jgi:hypothetical protein
VLVVAVVVLVVEEEGVNVLDVLVEVIVVLITNSRSSSDD